MLLQAMTGNEQAVKLRWHCSACVCCVFQALVTDSFLPRRLVLGQHLRKSILYSLNYQKFEALIHERAEDREFLSEGATSSNNSALTFFLLLAQELKTEKNVFRWWIALILYVNVICHLKILLPLFKYRRKNISLSWADKSSYLFLQSGKLSWALKSFLKSNCVNCRGF